MHRNLVTSLLGAALGALIVVGAAPLARAQERPAPRAVNVDAKVVLPARWSATQFFDALAKATNARIVAPLPDDKQLAQLNRNLDGQALTLQEIAPLYQKSLGYELTNLGGRSDLIGVRLPDALIYPTLSLDERYAAYLRLLVALSPAQIERMYLRDGLTVEDLTPAQRPLYLEARRKNENVSYVLGANKPLSDQQILAQTVRFRFAFQAVALFTDDEALPTLALFDYGTGLAWDPLVGADTKKLESLFDEGTMVKEVPTPAKQAAGDVSKALNTPVGFGQTQATTLGAALDQIGRASGQTVAFGAGLNARRLRATPLVISGGNYKAGELTAAVAASAGLEFGFLNNVPTLTRRRPQQPISQLPPLVDQAQQKLRRLPLRGSGLPFSQDRFDGKEVSYDYLSGAEKFFLRAKLLNENTKGYDEIDLSKHSFRFANRLYFIGKTGSLNSPFVTSSLQIW